MFAYNGSKYLCPNPGLTNNGAKGLGKFFFFSIMHPSGAYYYFSMALVAARKKKHIF